MRQFKTSNQQAIFDIITKFDEMQDKGSVCFPSEAPYFELIGYFEREGLIERALEVADGAIGQFAFNADFHLAKAMLLLKLDRADLALPVLDTAGGLAPGMLRANTLRAQGLAALNLKAEAFELLDSLKDTARDQELSEILVCEALIYERERSFERVFYLLKAALEANPMNFEALQRIWLCVENASKHLESVQLHERIIDEDPFSYLAWYNLGAAYHYLCEYEKAIEAYEYAFLINQDFEYAYRDCAEVCLYLRDFQKALQCYQEVIKRFEPDADLLNHSAQCHFELGNHKVAKSFYLKAASMDACCGESFFGMGKCAAALGNFKEAADNFRKAIMLEDYNELYYEALAEACFQLGEFRKAEKYYRQAADIAPEDAHFWMKLARFLILQNRSSEALDVLEEAEDYTYGSDLLYCRSACLFLMGEKKQAMLVLGDALFEDFDAHRNLFQWLPLLEHDTEVRAIIATLKPDVPDNAKQLKR